MGLEEEAVAYIEKHFDKCITFQLELVEGEPVPTVAVIDLMQYIMSVEDGGIPLDRCLEGFSNNVKWIMLRKGSTIRTCIVAVDLAPLPVKKLVVGDKRRSKVDVYPCEGLAYPRAGYLPVDGQRPVPSEWKRFACSQKLLRRELYPRLFNMFMSCRFFTPNVGQSLILSGFPGRSHYQTLHVQAPWESFRNDGGEVWQIRYWDEARELPITPAMEAEDPDLYHRAYMVQNVVPCMQYPQGGIVRAEWVEGRSTLSEVDARMFWFDHFFRTEHMMFYCNDLDVFCVGGMYARERCVAKPAYQTTGGDDVHKRGGYKFRNRHTVCLPYRRKDKDQPGKGPQRFINLNMFYELVCEHPPFRAAGVASPMTLLAFMAALAGTDFIGKFLCGLGAEKIIYPTLLENLCEFRYLVQVNDVAGEGQTRRRRDIIMDEDAFKQFVRYCYLAKTSETAAYKKDVEAGRVRSLSYSELKKRAPTMPSANEIRLRCRQMEYCLSMWRNAPLGYEPDPFQQWFGMPYFPYVKDPVTGDPAMVQAVAPQSRCVDETFAANLKRVAVWGKRLYRESDYNKQ